MKFKYERTRINSCTNERQLTLERRWQTNGIERLQHTVRQNSDLFTVIADPPPVATVVEYLQDTQDIRCHVHGIRW
jgi:hypothetical protein